MNESESAMFCFKTHISKKFESKNDKLEPRF